MQQAERVKGGFNLKKAVIIISAAIFVLAGTYLFLRHLVSEAVKDISISDIDLENVGDGAYTGEYSAPPVSVTVQVTVTSHRIADIEILRHDNGLGSKAEKITDEIIGRQSLDVDAVSGATLSSVCILKAVENAVEKIHIIWRSKNENYRCLQIEIRLH